MKKKRISGRKRTRSGDKAAAGVALVGVAAAALVTVTPLHAGLDHLPFYTIAQMREIGLPVGRSDNPLHTPEPDYVTYQHGISTGGKVSTFASHRLPPSDGHGSHTAWRGN